MTIYGIVGAGGFAREVMPLVESQYANKPGVELVFIDKLESGKKLNGYRVLSDKEFLSIESNKYFNVAIADSVIRKRIVDEYTRAGIESFSVVANNHLNLSHNQIGEGAILCPFTTITANAKIGKFFHAHIYSYVTHDCIIGDYVTFAPGVKCNGNVTIHDHAFIGAGAVIRQGVAGKPLVIGEGAVVGMGAIVTRNVNPYTTVVGNPAKPLIKQ